MEVVDEQLRTRILDTVTVWATARYGERITTGAVEQAHVFRTSSESGADYIVSLDILDDPAPLRIKVFVALDGSLRISD